MEVLEGKEAVLCNGELTLSNQLFEVDGFSLKAYNELESFFEEPEPHMELELTSAAVIAFIGSSNSILLVQTEGDGDTRRIELPAGKVNEDDIDIFDTAIREFREETGLEEQAIDRDYIRPLISRRQVERTGGLQFITDIDPIYFRSLVGKRVDDMGRVYLKPNEGTDKGRTVMLITEPLELFADSERSLLRHTKHRWAIDDYVISTLLLMGLRRAERINDIQQIEVLTALIGEKSKTFLD